MLQKYKSPLRMGEDEPAHDVPLIAGPSPAQTFTAVIAFVRRQIFSILSVVPLTLGVATIYLFTTPTLYTGRASIAIDSEKVQVFKSILGEDPVKDSAIVEGDIALLKSENFALSLVKNLHLDQDAEFVRPNRGLIGEAISTAISILLHPFAMKEPESEYQVTWRALRAFQSQLSVSRLGLAYVIEIEFQSVDPDRAAQIASAVADAFVVDQLEAKFQTIGKATAWLQDRLSELRAQASAAERAVVEYKSSNNIVDTGGRLNNEQQVVELTTALGKARADTVEARARYDRVSQILRGNDLDPSEIGTVVDALRNETISKLRQQYLELSQREALFSSRYGRSHLAVVNLRNQMHEIRRSILDEFKRIVEAHKSEYDIAKARDKSLEASLAATVAGSQNTNKAQIELRQLESAAQSYRALYDNFQQRYTDSVQQQSFPITQARVAAHAVRPAEPSSPKPLPILVEAVIGGLVIGFGLGLLREIADRVFRTSSQVEGKLKTQCVASIPVVAPSTKGRGTSNRSHAGSASIRHISRNTGLFSLVLDSPLSRFAESVRAVKIAVDLSGAPTSNKVVGITSSLASEGKSTISASLAQLCAYAGARVILVRFAQALTKPGPGAKRNRRTYRRA